MTDAILGTTTTLQGLDGDGRRSRSSPGMQSADDRHGQGPRHHAAARQRRGDLQGRHPGRHADAPRQQGAASSSSSSPKRTKAPAPEFAEFQQGLFAKLRDRFLGV